MEEVARRPNVAYIAPALPPKVKQKSTTYTQITSDSESYDPDRNRSISSMHPIVLNSKSPTTVFLAATQTRNTASQPSEHNGQHIVTIRINTEEKSKPKISSVRLKTEPDYDLYKKNTFVRINGDDNLTKIDERDEADSCRPPYIYCNSYNQNMVMSSGQCSPSDTLDSGTCSDLDSTPPPLPKKKSTKPNKKVSLTIIGNRNDEDNDSNISYDSLNSSELNSENKENGDTDNFLPRGLLQDIRDRSKSSSETESVDSNQNFVPIKDSRLSNGIVKATPAIISTYEERNRVEKKIVQDVSDTDKFYDFHLNENQFGEVESASVNKCVDECEYFAGIKDFNSEGKPSTIKSSKGTIRGVKNRVRAGIATFLQIQSTAKNYKEKDAGKVVIYTTTMGIVRNTYQRCVLIKKILRNLLVKYEERDVFMSMEYQDEIRDRMKCDQIMVPQLFVDGQYIGDADAVEKLNENGELRKMLKPYKSPDACNTCQVCGGFRLLPCRICRGSKKSLHRNHFTAEFVALKCMNCDEVGLVRCEECS